MKKLVNLAAATFFGLTTISLGAAGDKDAIIKEEKAIWQTVKDKNYDAFRKYLTSDYRGVYKEGITNTEQELATVKKADLKSMSLGDMEVVFLDNDAVRVTYQITVQGTQDGKDTSGSYNCASIWKKSGNEWRVAFHTEIKAE
jgi:hypothetical protein